MQAGGGHPAGRPLVVGHRGGSVVHGRPAFGENTLPAFRHTLTELRLPVELDVKLTADRAPVVFHDALVARVTGAPGLVGDRTRAELAGCPVTVLGSPGNGLHSTTAPEPAPIPDLADVLAEVVQTAGNAVVELKNLPRDPDFEPPERYVAVVLDAIDASALDDDRVTFISFHDGNLEAVVARRPAARIGLLAAPGRHEAALALAAQRRYALVAPRWPIADDEDARAAFVARAHEADLLVACWTVNRPQDVRAAVAAGIDALISDDPAMVLSALDER